MTYEEAVSYIINSYEVGHKHDFTVIKEVLNYLGNPQDNLKIIHVAGTNGKGSTCSMLTSILIETGYKTGTFTSPHMDRFNERLMLNGEIMTDEDFSHYVSIVKDASMQVFSTKEESLSFFEIFTIMCFIYFYNKRVDYLVLEVGLGGRKDCTNVISNPILSVITSISFDHTNFLGNTLSAIAAEKGGIVKKNCPVVLYLNDKEVYNVIKEICELNNAKLYYLYEQNLEIIAKDLENTIFSVKTPYYSYDEVVIHLIGNYQVYNTSNLLLVIHALKQQGVCVTKESVLKGLKKAKWPGRMEVVSKKPFVFLDGAHNFHAIKELNCFIEEYFLNKQVIIVAGILQDKQYHEMIIEIAKHADTLIITKGENKRFVDTSSLLNELDKTKVNHNLCIEDYKEAIEHAYKISTENSVICVTGSLYLIADVRRYINRRSLND